MAAGRRNKAVVPAKAGTQGRRCETRPTPDPGFRRGDSPLAPCLRGDDTVLRRHWAPGFRRGDIAARRYFICTDPLTVTETTPLPGSTGSASSAPAAIALARIIGTGAKPGGSLLDTLTSRIA
jgi:hypothetical protein